MTAPVQKSSARSRMARIGSGLAPAIMASLMLAACGTPATAPSPASKPPVPSAGETAKTGSSPDGSPGLMKLGASSDGQTITVAVGRTVLVSLGTTDWTFAQVSDPAVVRQSPQAVVPGPLSCRSMADCGSVSVRLSALAAGKVHVRATRSKCGELRLCTGKEGSFTLTVVVR